MLHCSDANPCKSRASRLETGMAYTVSPKALFSTSYHRAMVFIQHLSHRRSTSSLSGHKTRQITTSYIPIPTYAQSRVAHFRPVLSGKIEIMAMSFGSICVSPCVVRRGKSPWYLIVCTKTKVSERHGFRGEGKTIVIYLFRQH